jgi:DNA repair protein RadC
VSQGAISTSIVSPFDLFKAPIIANSPAIIGLHNHPSLDPAPSREDRDCTVRLVKAGTILGIRVLDHIIAEAVISTASPTPECLTNPFLKNTLSHPLPNPGDA